MVAASRNAGAVVAAAARANAAEEAEASDDVEDRDALPAVAILQDAVEAADRHGWRLDSEAEDEQDDEELQEDGFQVRARRRPARARPPRVPAARAVPAAPVERNFTGIREAHLVFQVRDWGQLRYDTRLHILSAHCRCDNHGTCRLNRSCRVGRREAQGRPLGFLLAWLKACRAEHAVEFVDRESHALLGNTAPGALYRDHVCIGYDERVRLRSWAKTVVELAPIFTDRLENGPRSATGEIEEPFDLP